MKHAPRLIKNRLTMNVLVSTCAHLIEIGRYHDGIELLERYIGEQPKSTNALRMLSYMYCQVYQYHKAEKAIEKAIGISPQSSENYAQAGLIKLRLKQIKDAKVLYSKSLRINPIDSVANCGWAVIYRLENNHEYAIEYLKTALEFSPSNEAASLLLARTLIDNNLLEPALNELYSIVEKKMASANTFELMGLLHIRLRNLSEAKDMFDAALDLNPNSISSKVGLGRLIALGNKYEEANHYFEEMKFSN